MKGETAFRAIGNIPDQYIEEADLSSVRPAAPSPGGRWRSNGLVAAAVSVVVGLGVLTAIILFSRRFTTTPPVAGTDHDTTQVETATEIEGTTREETETELAGITQVETETETETETEPETETTPAIELTLADLFTQLMGSLAEPLEPPTEAEPGDRVPLEQLRRASQDLVGKRITLSPGDLPTYHVAIYRYTAPSATDPEQLALMFGDINGHFVLLMETGYGSMESFLNQAESWTGRVVLLRYLDWADFLHSSNEVFAAQKAEGPYPATADSPRCFGQITGSGTTYTDAGRAETGSSIIPHFDDNLARYEALLDAGEGETGPAETETETTPDTAPVEIFDDDGIVYTYMSAESVASMYPDGKFSFKIRSFDSILPSTQTIVETDIPDKIVTLNGWELQMQYKSTTIRTDPNTGEKAVVSRSFRGEKEGGTISMVFSADDRLMTLSTPFHSDQNSEGYSEEQIERRALDLLDTWIPGYDLDGYTLHVTDSPSVLWYRELHGYRITEDECMVTFTADGVRSFDASNFGKGAAFADISEEQLAATRERLEEALRKLDCYRDQLFSLTIKEDGHLYMQGCAFRTVYNETEYGEGGMWSREEEEILYARVDP